MIVEDARKRTKLLTLHLNRLIILLDAGTRRAAKSEPISVFVRGDNGGEIFVGLEDMVPNDDVCDCDPDAPNAAAYDAAVQKIFAVSISPGSGFWTGWWVLCLTEQLSWARMWQG